MSKALQSSSITIEEAAKEIIRTLRPHDPGSWDANMPYVLARLYSLFSSKEVMPTETAGPTGITQSATSASLKTSGKWTKAALIEGAANAVLNMGDPKDGVSLPPNAVEIIVTNIASALSRNATNGPDSRIPESSAQRICPHCGQPHLSDDEIMHVCSKPSVTAQQEMEWKAINYLAEHYKRVTDDPVVTKDGTHTNECSLFKVMTAFALHENAELVRQRDAAQKDRDSLMSALGWKVEAPVDGFILEDARMLRPEMAKARARVMELQSDAEWANYLAEDKPKEFAVKIFRLYKEQKQRAETAEAQRDEYKGKWNDVLEHEDKILALARKLEAQLREKERELAEIAQRARKWELDHNYVLSLYKPLLKSQTAARSAAFREAAEIARNPQMWKKMAEKDKGFGNISVAGQAIAAELERIAEGSNQFRDSGEMVGNEEKVKAAFRDDAASVDIEGLAKHWLFTMQCNHETSSDKAMCACGWSGGWRLNVGEAAKEWAQHVADVLRRGAAPLQGGRIPKGERGEP